MEMTRHYPNNSAPPKIERKYVEKNRRNQMKTLYSKLGSLLPSHNSKEVVALPDQIDEAVNYIKSLQRNVEKSKQKKEMLTTRKRDLSFVSTSGIFTSSRTKLPQIEIHEMGQNMDIILVNGLENPLCFYEILQLLHQEGAEVLHANFSATGNSMFHIMHQKIGDDATLNFEGNYKILRRLKELIHGSPSSSFNVESPLNIWDFDF